MKKTYRLENLDCANCAAKMENAINKLPGVKANISFMTQKLVLEVEPGNPQDRLEEVQKIITSIERDCTIVA